MMDDGWSMMDDWWWRMADGDLAALLGGLGAILQRLEASWSGLGLVLGRSWGKLAAILGGVGAILERLAASWGVLKRSWNVLGRSWGDLAAILDDLGAILKRLEAPWGGFRSLCRFENGLNAFLDFILSGAIVFFRCVLIPCCVLPDGPARPAKKTTPSRTVIKFQFVLSPSLRGH